MPNLSSLTLEQLIRAVAIKREIEVLKSQLDNIEGDGAVVIPVKRGRKPKLQLPNAVAQEPWKRKFSAASRAKMAAAQQARWAKRKGTTVDSVAGIAPEVAVAEEPKKKRKMTKSEAAKARWAKIKAEKADKA